MLKSVQVIVSAGDYGEILFCAAFHSHCVLTDMGKKPKTTFSSVHLCTKCSTCPGEELHQFDLFAQRLYNLHASAVIFD